MHSATSLQGLGLVRTVGPCAQTRVAIETHSRTLLSGEFEQLLLACSESVAYAILGSKFVCYYLYMHTVLTDCWISLSTHC